MAIGLLGVGNVSNAFLIVEAQATCASAENIILAYAGFNLTLASYPTGFLTESIGRA